MLNHEIRFRDRQTRRGVAPLEFVLSLPWLVMLAATIFSIFFLFDGRAQTAIEARRAAWSARSSSTALQTGSPLSALALVEPLSGQHVQVLKRPVPIHHWVGAPGSVFAGNAVLVGWWDQQQVPAFDGNGPHLSVLGMMLEQGQEEQGQLNQFSNGLRGVPGLLGM